MARVGEMRRLHLIAKAGTKMSDKNGVGERIRRVITQAIRHAVMQ